jgi:hypothetical protein
MIRTIQLHAATRRECCLQDNYLQGTPSRTRNIAHEKSKYTDIATFENISYY